MDKLIPALAGSRQLAIYHAAKEPLVDTAHDLMADLRVLAPTILETRVRKYQVFPGRTHPLMTSKAGGGFVLWGTRVVPSDDVRAGGKRRRRNPLSAASKNEAGTEASEDEQDKVNAKRKLNGVDENSIKEKRAKVEAGDTDATG